MRITPKIMNITNARIHKTLDFKLKVVLYLKIFKKIKYFFIEFFNYICYFDPKKSSLDGNFEKFQMIYLKEPAILK